MLDKLRRYCKEHRRRPENIVVVVGYSQSYALEVHERTDVSRRVGGPKFLENALRKNENRVREALRRAKIEEMPDAMVRVGLLIQRDSQLECPVDTSALRASAYTALQAEADRAATEANSRAEVIRTTVLKSREAKARKEKRKK